MQEEYNTQKKATAIQFFTLRLLKYHSNTSQLPLVAALSPSISCKLSTGPEDAACLSADILFNNRTTLAVKSIYEEICQNKLNQICSKALTQLKWDSSLFQFIDVGRLGNLKQIWRGPQEFLKIRVSQIDRKMRIFLTQHKSWGQVLSICRQDLLTIFLYILGLITPQIERLGEKMGLLSQSFSGRLKNNNSILQCTKRMKAILKQCKKQIPQKIIQNPQKRYQGQEQGVFKKLKVVNQRQLPADMKAFRKGGYFNIVKRAVEINNEQKMQHQLVFLAQKRLSSRKRPNSIFNYQAKLPKEVNFLERLSVLPKQDLNRFAQYFKVEFPHLTETAQKESDSDNLSKATLSTTQSLNQSGSNADVIFMKYYEESLEDYLKQKTGVCFGQVLDILNQIFLSVKALHKVGIVHRDIKPANFMLEQLAHKQYATKLIDFGESTLMNLEYSENQLLGFSVNYAPIECTSNCKEGYNAKQIDLWSLGVMVFELTKRRLPVCYSKCFKSDIYMGWPQDLSFFINRSSRGQWKVFQNMLVVLSMMMMRVKPQKRLGLEMGLKIIQQIQSFSKQAFNKF